MKPFVKIPGAVVYITHRCTFADCGQFFRSEAERAEHEKDRRHCSACGMGYVGLEEGSSATYCPGCMLDMTPFSKSIKSS